MIHAFRTPNPQPCPPAPPPPPPAPPVEAPPAEADPRQVALAELDSKLARLPDLAARLPPANARGVYRRWLQLRWMRVALARSTS